MFHCRDVTEEATAYMEGDLSWPRKLLFLLHVGFCVHCLRYLRQLREGLRAMRDLPAEPPTPEVTDQLVAMFRQERAGP